MLLRPDLTQNRGRVQEYAWTQFPIEGLRLPGLPKYTTIQVGLTRAVWTSGLHVRVREDATSQDRVTLHGLGMPLAAHSYPEAQARLRQVAQNATLAVMPGEQNLPSAHAKITLRRDRGVVLDVFDQIGHPHPRADVPLVVSCRDDRVIVGVYADDEHQAWPVFAVC